LNHSISLENISPNHHSNALQYNNKYSKSAISLNWNSPNHKKIKENTNSKLKLKAKSSSSLNHYHLSSSRSSSSSSSSSISSSSSSSSSDSDDDNEDDDDVPLGVLRKRRPSLSSVMTV